MRAGGYGRGRGTYGRGGGAAAGSNREGGAPDNLKCQVCNKVKPKDQFANRQLQKFSSYNKAFTRNPASVNVTCKVCTPAQTVELTCYICDTTKGLEEFAKNQRKDPDRARCMKCVNRVLETEPELAPPSSDEEDDEDDTDEDEWERPREASVGNASIDVASVQAHPRAGPRTVSPPQSRASGRPAGYAPSTASAAWSTSSAQSSINSRAGGPVRPGNTSGVIAQRNPAPQAQGYSANVPPKSASSNADTDGVWETVGVAGPPVAKYGSPWGGGVPAGSTTETASHRSTSTSRQAPQNVKKNGWATVSKVPKGKESRWGEGNAAEHHDEAEDEWARYGREIRDAKAGKVPKKKKKAAISDSE